MSILTHRSLTMQTMLIMAGGLILAYSLSTLLYSRDRLNALTHLGLKNTALTVMHLVHSVGATDPELRQQIQGSLSNEGVALSVTREPAFENAKHWDSYQAVLLRNLQDAAHENELSSLRFRLLKATDITTHNSFIDQSDTFLLDVQRSIYGLPNYIAVQIAVQIEDGTWVNVETSLPEFPRELWSPSFLPMGLLTLAIILTSGWAVRRMLKPLNDVATAAQEFAHDINAPPMPANVSYEARAVADAFNEMQSQLKRIIQNRTEMMGAISHDLRTPLSLVRLRTESLPNSRDRERLLCAVDEMDAIISATLDFAKHTFNTEVIRNVDIAALVEAICEDQSEAGSNVCFEKKGHSFVFSGQSVALRRCFTNLIGNAVKFGNAVKVQIDAQGPKLIVTVEDDGPGIASDDIDRVFEPFYRCDRARSNATKGTGLGLSLAKSIIEAHGGKIELANLDEGGLSVRVEIAQSDSY